MNLSEWRCWLKMTNGWAELLNEILDCQWLYCCLSHCIEFTFCWRMSIWSLSSACWLKIDIEDWNQWTTRWLPWYSTTCPVWIWIADNLNRKLAFLIPDWKLKLHDEDEVSCLIDIFEQTNEIFDVLILRVDEQSWELLDRVLEVILELSHPKKFSNSWPQVLMNDFVTLSFLIVWKSLKFEFCGCGFARDLKDFEQLINELLREFHCDVAMLEFLGCSAQKLDRILWSEEVDVLECKLLLKHWDDFFEHLSTSWMTKSPTYVMTASWTWPNWSFLTNACESDFIWAIPLLTMIWEKWACHGFGASLRPYSWRFRRQTIGSE